MRIFKKYIILYLCGVFIGFLCIELALFTCENEFSYKKHYIENHFNDIKVLSLGSSLLETGFDPSIIGDSVFNGNLSGIKSIYMNSVTYQLAFKYIPQMKNLEFLIVPFAITDTYAGSKNWGEKREPAYICMGVKYLNILTQPKDILYWSEIVNSNMGYMGRFKKTDEENRLCDSLGFFSRNRDLKDRKQGWEKGFVGKKIAVQTLNDTYSVVQAYNDIANLCKENGVKLIAIATPFYKTRQEQIPQQLIAHHHYVITKIKKKYPTTFNFYDYTYDRRFNTDDFQDAVHLNNSGARKLSKIIKKEILKL
jgi:RNase H-fold protein (predicted Holliday junction resolvase)